jgi:hypothetical protein
MSHAVRRVIAAVRWCGLPIVPSSGHSRRPVLPYGYWSAPCISSQAPQINAIRPRSPNCPPQPATPTGNGHGNVCSSIPPVVRDRASPGTASLYFDGRSCRFRAIERGAGYRCHSGPTSKPAGAHATCRAKALVPRGPDFGSTLEQLRRNGFSFTNTVRAYEPPPAHLRGQGQDPL